MEQQTSQRRRSYGLTLAVALATSVAAPLGGAEDAVVNVGNVEPLVVSVTLPGSTINPTSGSTTSVATTIVVADLNGYNDISSVAVEVRKPDGSTTHVASSAATFSTGASTEATYTHSFDMNFYDDPALSTDTYKVKVTVTDSQGATGTNLADLAVFNYAQLAALNLNLSSLDLGSSISPNSTSDVVPLGVQNYGNVQIDLQLSGTNMTHETEEASIFAGRLNHSQSSDMGGKASLGLGASTNSTFDLAKGASSSKSLYWQLSVPSGEEQWVPSGSYTGSVTIAAVAG